MMASTTPLRSVSLTVCPTWSGESKTRKVIACSRGSSDVPVPNFLSSNWLESRKKRPFGPRLDFSAEEAVQCQHDALKYNDQCRQYYGIEVMYWFAGFDPFERSSYFGPHFDLDQQNRFKQRVWVRGSRPEEEEVFQFTMVQGVGGSRDGYCCIG